MVSFHLRLDSLVAESPQLLDPDLDGHGRAALLSWRRTLVVATPDRDHCGIEILAPGIDAHPQGPRINLFQILSQALRKLTGSVIRRDLASIFSRSPSANGFPGRGGARRQPPTRSCPPGSTAPSRPPAARRRRRASASPACSPTPTTARPGATARRRSPSRARRPRNAATSGA